MTEEFKFFLQTKASFRTLTKSVLVIYDDGTGIFDNFGCVKSAEPEHIGDFICLLSIDQMNYKAEKDFNAAMWEWKCKRNEDRSELEKLYGYDTKNASHLVRLMEQAKYIMNYGDYDPTLHGETLQMVKDVRAGKFTYEEILEYGDSVDAELNELYKTTLLPKKADMVGINNLVLKLQGF